MTPISDPERIRWQRQAVTILSHLLDRAATEHLPVLSWTIGDAGATLAGRSHAIPDADRGPAIQAWAAALGLDVREHSHGGMTTLTAHGKQMSLAGTWASVTVTADVWDDEDADPASQQPQENR